MRDAELPSATILNGHSLLRLLAYLTLVIVLSSRRFQLMQGCGVSQANPERQAQSRAICGSEKHLGLELRKLPTFHLSSPCDPNERRLLKQCRVMFLLRQRVRGPCVPFSNEVGDKWSVKIADR